MALPDAFNIFLYVAVGLSVAAMFVLIIWAYTVVFHCSEPHQILGIIGGFVRPSPAQDIEMQRPESPIQFVSRNSEGDLTSTRADVEVPPADALPSTDGAATITSPLVDAVITSANRLRTPRERLSKKEWSNRGNQTS